MGPITIRSERIDEAAEILARVMQDEPEGIFILPDPDERLDVQRATCRPRWLMPDAEAPVI